MEVCYVLDTIVCDFYKSVVYITPYQQFLDLTDDRKRKVMSLFRLMATHAKIHDETKFRYEGDNIYAFKPQPDRYLCFFFKGKKIIVTNAFEKRTQKMREQEKDRALKAYNDYEMRIAQGMYYEKE